MAYEVVSVVERGRATVFLLRAPRYLEDLSTVAYIAARTHSLAQFAVYLLL